MIHYECAIGIRRQITIIKIHWISRDVSYQSSCCVVQDSDMWLYVYKGNKCHMKHKSVHFNVIFFFHVSYVMSTHLSFYFVGSWLMKILYTLDFCWINNSLKMANQDFMNLSKLITYWLPILQRYDLCLV